MRELTIDAAILIVIAWSACWHWRAVRRFLLDRRLARSMAATGQHPPELAAWFSNQVIRYQYRLWESMAGLVLVSLAMLGLYWPPLRSAGLVQALDIAFILSLVGGSGWLSRRDLKLRDRIRDLNNR